MLTVEALWIIADYDRDLHPFADMFQNTEILDKHAVRPQMEEICRHILDAKASAMMKAHGDGDKEISTRLRDVGTIMAMADSMEHSPLLNAAGAYIMTLSALGSMGTGAWNKYASLVEDSYTYGTRIA